LIIISSAKTHDGIDINRTLISGSEYALANPSGFYEIITTDGRVASPPEHPDYVTTIPVTQ